VIEAAATAGGLSPHGGSCWRLLAHTVPADGGRVPIKVPPPPFLALRGDDIDDIELLFFRVRRFSLVYLTPRQMSCVDNGSSEEDGRLRPEYAGGKSLVACVKNGLGIDWCRAPRTLARGLICVVLRAGFHLRRGRVEHMRSSLQTGATAA